MNTSTLIAPPAIVRRAEQHDTKAIQALDSAHYLHPFTDHADLATRGARVITHGEGIYIWDSEGQKILDAMSGLWCVNAGYGRKELADAAYQQMMTLPFYNSFFQTTTPPAVLERTLPLVARPARCASAAGIAVLVAPVSTRKSTGTPDRRPGQWKCPSRARSSVITPPATLNCVRCSWFIHAWTPTNISVPASSHAVAILKVDDRAGAGMGSRRCHRGRTAWGQA